MLKGLTFFAPLSPVCTPGPFFEVWNANQNGQIEKPPKPLPSPHVQPPPMLPPIKDGQTAPKLQKPRGSSNGGAAAALPGLKRSTEEGVRFEAAEKFEGARPGMVFKMGEKGLGYYTDTAASSSSAAMPVYPTLKVKETIGDSRTVVRYSTGAQRFSLAAQTQRVTVEGGWRVTTACTWSARRPSADAELVMVD